MITLASHSLQVHPLTIALSHCKKKKYTKSNVCCLYTHWNSQISRGQTLKDNWASPPQAINYKDLHFSTFITIFKDSSIASCLGCFFGGTVPQQSSMSLILSHESTDIDNPEKEVSLAIAAGHSTVMDLYMVTRGSIALSPLLLSEFW